MIIGPQHPGAVSATIVPPPRIGPSIGRRGSSTPSVYEVTVMLTDTNPEMRWGMTANVAFENDN